jgi:hypothetical protein
MMKTIILNTSLGAALLFAYMIQKQKRKEAWLSVKSPEFTTTLSHK